MINRFETRACDRQIASLAREAVARNGLPAGCVVLLLECDDSNELGAYVVPHAGASKQWPIIASLGGPSAAESTITIIHLVCSGGDHAIKGARRTEVTP
jgi:hypothetical protein